MGKPARDELVKRIRALENQIAAASANADRSYVFQFSDDQKSVSCTHEWCAEGIKPTIERIQDVPVETFPWVMKKFLHGDMVLVPRLSDLPPEAIKEKQEF